MPNCFWESPMVMRLFPVKSSAPPMTTSIRPVENTAPPMNLVMPIPSLSAVPVMTMVASSAPKPMYAPAKMPRMIICRIGRHAFVLPAFDTASATCSGVLKPIYYLHLCSV